VIVSKKVFPCGHKGKGQYCHRCEQEQKELIQKQQEQAVQQQALLYQKEEAQRWKALFDQDTIDLRALASQKLLVEKARDIIAAIEAGQSYTDFKGKRMRFDRDVISVPLGYDWRLIFYPINGRYVCQELLSHEDYNVRKPGLK
jgi:hypothetical protein